MRTTHRALITTCQTKHAYNIAINLPPVVSEALVNFPSLSLPGSFDSDPVVNTLRQLKSDDRRDRDMCCGECTGGSGGGGRGREGHVLW